MVITDKGYHRLNIKTLEIINLPVDYIHYFDIAITATSTALHKELTGAAG